VGCEQSQPETGQPRARHTGQLRDVPGAKLQEVKTLTPDRRRRGDISGGDTLDSQSDSNLRACHYIEHMFDIKWQSPVPPLPQVVSPGYGANYLRFARSARVLARPGRAQSIESDGRGRQMEEKT
jgi:hypothetical protein